jgi:hypothetical protein
MDRGWQPMFDEASNVSAAAGQVQAGIRMSSPAPAVPRDDD